MAGERQDVLVITGGLVPALVTETLYALAMQANAARVRDPFWPERLIVAGTEGKLAAFNEQGLQAKIDELCGVFRRRAPTPEPAEPEGVEDIRTDADAVAFGDKMVSLLRGLTADNADPPTRLHVSLAGGRKTMSFHAGAALSLYGRPFDCLSHVLLGPVEAERAIGFWYPTNYDLILPLSQRGPVPPDAPTTINARYIEVDLAFIPYLSVRDRLPKDLLENDFSYKRVIELASLAEDASRLRLILHAPSREVRLVADDGAGDRLATLKLSEASFAFLTVMAEWRCDRITGVGPEGLGRQHDGWLSYGRLSRPQDHDQPNPVTRYLELHSRLHGGFYDGDRTVPPFPDTESKVAADFIFNLESKSQTAPDTAAEANQNYFQSVKSDIESTFKNAIPSRNAREQLFAAKGRPARFGIGLAPTQVEIVWD